jgi:hypothetical protein
MNLFRSGIVFGRHFNRLCPPALALGALRGSLLVWGLESVFLVAAAPRCGLCGLPFLMVDLGLKERSL